jgi:hypothetical protein
MNMTFRSTRKKGSTATPADDRPRENPFRDLSLWLLLASNGVTILLATTQGWNLLALMWVYWFQNIVIGFFNFVRIRQLKEFSTEGFSINGRPAEPTQETKNHVARFFLLHYGFFHLAYFIFLLIFSLNGMFGSVGENALNVADLKYIIPTALLFLGNHVFSYFYNRPRDTGRQKIGSLMFYPYARIIPMHLTIILGAFLGGGLLLFLLLKTLADAIMHIVEHRVLLRRQVQGGDETMKSEQKTGGDESTESEQETTGSESLVRQVTAEEKQLTGYRRGEIISGIVLVASVIGGMAALARLDPEGMELAIGMFAVSLYALIYNHRKRRGS